ncbi:hypothetical protein OQA88_11121 [Cercophora sp. LCS_1]
MMNPISPKYQDLPTTDPTPDDPRQESDYEDDEDETDKLAWDDDAVRNPSMRRRRAKSIRSAISTFRAVLDTILLFVIVGLLLERRASRGNQDQRYQIAGDITAFSPTFSQQIKSFAPDPGFIPDNVSEFFSIEVQKKWLGIVPSYVTINDTTQYDNLPAQLEYYPPGTYTTSMTHQLHCLHAIVEVVAALTSNQTNRMPPEGPWHLAHCFDYLRQSIMCAGDMALEGQQTTFPTGFRGSDGWDAKHVCKDYGQIISHLESHRADDEAVSDGMLDEIDEIEIARRVLLPGAGAESRLAAEIDVAVVAAVTAIAPISRQFAIIMITRKSAYAAEQQEVVLAGHRYPYLPTPVEPHVPSGDTETPLFGDWHDVEAFE